MRRFLILLLVLVLPLKAAAADFVALAGAPGHMHAAQKVNDKADNQAGVSTPHRAAGGAQTAHCVWMAGDEDSSNAPAGSVHDHACPHLGMVSIATGWTCHDGANAPVVSPAHTPVHFSSITLDVPRPPPTTAR